MRRTKLSPDFLSTKPDTSKSFQFFLNQTGFHRHEKDLTILQYLNILNLSDGQRMAICKEHCPFEPPLFCRSTCELCQIFTSFTSGSGRTSMPCCPGSCRPSRCFLKIRKDRSIQKSFKNRSKKTLQSLHVSFAWINPKERILQHPCLIICAHVLMIDDVENGSRVRETNEKVGKVEIDMISWRNVCTSISKVSKSFTCATTRCSLKKYQQNLHNPQKPKCPPCLLQTVHKTHVEVRQGNVVDVLAKWIFKLLRAAIWLTNPSQSNLISSYLISS